MTQLNAGFTSAQTALLVVDLQNDFLPGGALAVTDGDAIVATINRYIAFFSANRHPIFFTRDWHPPEHCSFIDQGGPWPPHCIAGSPGARFAPNLRLPADARIISKAQDRERDAYSGFQDTPLAAQLEKLGVKRIYVGGLATDYCVKFTVLDGLRLGFEVHVLIDAIRAVNAQPGDGERALQAMLDAGASSMQLEQLPA